MRIKILAGIAGCLTAFLIWGPFALAEEILQICTFEYPLFMSQKPIPERGYGFLVDSTNAALEAVGLKAKYHFFPMKRSVAMVAKGEYDAFLGTIAHFPKETRGQFHNVKMGELRFILYYLNDENRPAFSFNELGDLKKYRFGTVSGSSSVPLLRKSGIEPDFARNLEINFSKLLAGRIDLCVALELPARYIINRLSPSQQSRITKIDKPIMSISVDFIVNLDRAGSERLYKKVEDGLLRIKNRGIYQEIVAHYYGNDEF